MEENNAYKAPMTTGELEKKPPRPKKASVVPWILAAFVLGVILVGMLLPAVQVVRSNPRRLPCLRNLRQLSIAMLNYASANGHFPPAYIADEDLSLIHI